MTEVAFNQVLLAALIGLLLSVVLDQLLAPRTRLRRSAAAWALHLGLWLGVHAVFTLLLARPWFSAAGTSALLLMLVMVNNAKYKALREPFVFQDYEYFTDAIRFPRLYIPFMGWWKFLAAAAGFVLAVAIGWYGEAAPVARFAINGQLGAVLLSLLLAMICLWFGNRAQLLISLEPEQDLRSHGLLACLWRYGQKSRELLQASSPLEQLTPSFTASQLPTLVAVQSESFFDVRTLFPGIRSEVLAEFDRLRADAVQHGKLSVPAWGANTVRSEFAFLTGLEACQLGIHKFNPYRAVAAGASPVSLAVTLKKMGYRTVCIHPYPARFYLRDRVYPALGFDEFIDINAFTPAQRFGPYTADMAVADKVAELVNATVEPLFIFVITMENHGPLHLEKVAPEDEENLYSAPPDKGCDDLTIYLRHLRNASRMIGQLRTTLEGCEQPASLCWYGDHVPIMPQVYRQYGVPSGEVDYVIWHNRPCPTQPSEALNIDQLAVKWLKLCGK